VNLFKKKSKAHQIHRLTAQILQEPVLAEVNFAKSVFNYLQERNSGNFNMQTQSDSFVEDGDDDLMQVNGKNGVAVIQIRGPLIYRRLQGIDAMCVGTHTSYESLEDAVKDVVALGNVSKIIFMVDSPGGQAYSAFETGSFIHKYAKDNGIKTVSYIDGQACSGGYALIAASDEIICNPDSVVGSIGVVCALISDLKKQIAEGTEVKFITYGDDKVPFEEDGSFSANYLKDAQEKVDAIGDKFVSHVAIYRNISEDVVKGTQARVFLADQALELGLVDKIMTREDFLNNLSFDSNSSKQENVMTVEVNEQVAQLKAQLEATMAENVALKTAQAVQEKVEFLSEYAFISDTSKVAKAVISGEGFEDTVVSILADAKVEIDGLKTQIENLKAEKVELTSKVEKQEEEELEEFSVRHSAVGEGEQLSVEEKRVEVVAKQLNIK
jgi:ClpP class serine protease